MRYFTKIIICILLFGILETSCLSAQSIRPGSNFGNSPPGSHRGAINTILQDERGNILSAGSDGFLEIWDINNNTATSRFQLSAQAIQVMVLHPNKTEISIIERNDRSGAYRISSWDYVTRRQIFSLSFREAVSYINYSANGSFLIASRRAVPIMLIHTETGELLPAPNMSTAISFATTGRSERNMVTYTPSGALSYWDLESKSETSNFNVPAQLRSPLLFSINRFLAGIDSSGLVILNAVSGNILARYRQITNGILLSLSAETTEFMCIAFESYLNTVYIFNIGNTGRLEIRRQWQIPSNIRSITSAVAVGNAVALGTGDGNVWFCRDNGQAYTMNVRNKDLIKEAAVVASSLAILTQDNRLAFIPLDFNDLIDSENISFDEVPYTQITGSRNELILWQDIHTRSLPVIRNTTTGDNTPIERLSLRFPLRTVSVLGDNALFLDSFGNITVISLTNRNIIFSFSSIASLDAVFLNETNILIGSAAVSGNAPFLLVNVRTGETVQLPYPASAAMQVYRGTSGTPYGVTLEQQGGFQKTAIIKLNTTNPSRSERLFEWDGEETTFDMLETNGYLKATLGNQGVFFYDPDKESIQFLERSPGLPRRIIDGENYIITIDSDGNIVWYDIDTRNLLAIFYLYKDGWILEKEGRIVLEGSVSS